jgi:hypothetical protein
MQNPFVNRFSYYDRQIVHNVREKGYLDEKSSAEWKEIENGVFPKSSKAIVVDALVETKWGQGWPWNEMCPADSLGNPCPVGCVATAMHQIMRFHQGPAQGVGSKSYNDVWGSTTGSHSVNFSSSVYDWDLMAPLTSGQVTTQAQIDELAELSYHCGVAVEMDYEASGSGAYISDVTSALESYFSFSTDATYLSVGTVTNATSQSTKIRTDLDIGHPIIWGGSGSQGGHAFILDGYTDDYYYHFNWGWEGNFDGWFQLNDLTPDSMDFTSSQSCVYDLNCSPGPYPPPPDLESCELINSEDVSITWSTNSYSLSVLHFNIYRNNELISQVPDSVFTYTDINLSPGSYIYYVKAVYDFYGHPYESPSSTYGFIDVIPDNIYPVPRNFETYLEPYNRQNIDLEWLKPFLGVIVWDEGFEYGDTDWTYKRTIDYPPTGRKVNTTNDNFTQPEVTDGWWLGNEGSFGDRQYIHSGDYFMGIGYTAPDYSWAIGPEISVPENCELRYWHWITGDSSTNWLTTSYVNTYSGDFSEADPSLLLNQIAEYIDIDEITENLYDDDITVPLNAGTYRLCWIYKYSDGYQMAVDDIQVGSINRVKHSASIDRSEREDLKRIPGHYTIVETAFPEIPRTQTIETDSLTGYEIYRNGIFASMINNPESLIWRDTNFEDGFNEYFVRAIYATGTSIPSNRSSEIMDANPKPGYLEAVYDGDKTIDLSWYSPYHAPEHWFGYTDEEFESHFDSIDGMPGTWTKRRTSFIASDIGLVYPITIDSISAAFYEEMEGDWTNNSFTFDIYTPNYAGTSDSIIYSSPSLAATSSEWTSAVLPEQLEMNWGWYIVLHVADDGTPSSFVNVHTDGTASHSDVYYGGDGTYTPDWYEIRFGSDKGDWAILCFGQGTAPVIHKNAAPEKLVFSSAKIIDKITGISDLALVVNSKHGGVQKGFLGYKIYRDNSEIATTDSTSYTDILSKELTTVDYHVTAFYEDPTGESAPSNVVTVTITSIEDNVPYETALSQN